MSLPRVLELVMAFFEDAVFIKQTQKPLLGSLKPRYFLWKNYMRKGKVFSGLMIQFPKRREKPETHYKGLKRLKHILRVWILSNGIA